MSDCISCDNKLARNHEGRISTNEANLHNTEKMLDQIVAELKELNEKADRIEKHVVHTNGKVAKAETERGQMHEEMRALEGNVDTVKEQTSIVRFFVKYPKLALLIFAGFLAMVISDIRHPIMKVVGLL